MSAYLNAQLPLREAAAAAITADANSGDQINREFKGLVLVVDITAITGTSPTLTVTIEGKDPVSGKYYTILASTALNAAGTTVLQVYPGMTAAANSKADGILPETWRVLYHPGGTSPSVDFTVGAVLVK